MRIIQRVSKQHANLTIDSQVLQRARGLGINLSHFVEEKSSGFAREALQQYSARVERDGPFNQDPISQDTIC